MGSRTEPIAPYHACQHLQNNYDCCCAGGEAGSFPCSISRNSWSLASCALSNALSPCQSAPVLQGRKTAERSIGFFPPNGSQLPDSTLISGLDPPFPITSFLTDDPP